MVRSAVKVSRIASTRTVVAEVVFVMTFAAVMHFVGNPWIALAAAVVIGALSFVRVGGRPVQWWMSSAVSYLGRGSTRRRRSGRSSVMSYPWRGDRIGMRWDGARLSASIEVNPLYSGPTLSSRESSASDTRLPLAALSQCLVQHDLGPVALDVTTHGKRAGTDPVATDVYHRLIGPLPTVAVRSIFVTVTVDAALTGRASDRRGPGFTGAAASLGVAIERVEHVLAAAGLGARVLTASEFSAVARYVSGASLRPESGRSGADAGWSHIDLTSGSWTARAVSAGSLSTTTLDRLSSLPTAATTTTLRLRASDRPGSVRASLAYGYSDEGSSTDENSISGSMSLRGRLQIARTGQVPPVTAGHDRIAPFADLDPGALADLRVPASGAGQLLGSDADGRGVTVRLFGPGTFTVHVSGELFLAKQLALRAIAIGARVLVATDRSDDWRRLAAALTDRRHLTVVESFGSDAAEPGVAHDLIIVDGRFSRPPSSSASTLYLVDDPAHFPQESADLVIVQPDCAGDRVELSWWSGKLDVTVVTIAQETALIGRPRPVLHAG